MNIYFFKLKPGGKIHLLSEHTYDEQTYKALPYVRRAKSSIKRYALCPVCENPIEILNLMHRANDDTPAHGRHVCRPIKGVGDFNRDRYENCPLKSWRSGNRDDVKILREHWDGFWSTFIDCCTIMGGHISETDKEKMINHIFLGAYK